MSVRKTAGRRHAPDSDPATPGPPRLVFTGTAQRGFTGMKAEHGVLVLADISGFTAFVTAVELEHGPQIIGALLEAVMRRLAPPLEIQEIEGDAVFALGPD